MDSSEHVVQTIVEDIQHLIAPFQQEDGDYRIGSDQFQQLVQPKIRRIVEDRLEQYRTNIRLDEKRRREAWSGT